MEDLYRIANSLLLFFSVFSVTLWLEIQGYLRGWTVNTTSPLPVLPAASRTFSTST
jgi:hypothetical protein